LTTSTISSISSLTKKQKQDEKSAEIDEQFRMAAQTVTTALRALGLPGDIEEWKIWVAFLGTIMSPETAMGEISFRDRILVEGLLSHLTIILDF
jgi:hypothetical protein